MQSVLARRPAETTSAAELAPRRSASPAALEAVTQQANQRIEAAFSLARRGAMFAARAELIQSLRMIAQALDTLEQTNHHSRALAEGFKAIEEADDFYVSTTHLENDLQLSEIVAGHETPVLKGEALEQSSSLVALQRYFAFAQQRLTTAAGGAPAGSKALYGLGKVHMSLAGSSHDERSHQLPKAIVYHQAALATDPNNYLAANEVGVLLAQFGQLDAAKRVLVHSVQVRSHVEGWQNLAVVHARLGESDLARLAQQEQALLVAQQGAPPTAPTNLVEWVNPQTFAARGTPDDETRTLAAARSAARKVPAPSGSATAVRR
jgi:tetratricopeptide (TPR) repeat protein